MKASRHSRFIASVFTLAPFAAAIATPTLVPCDKPVQSKKRGVCVNKADAKDFMALAPGVSWYYTWHFADTNNAPKDAKMQFIPMVWGNRSGDIEGLANYLKSNKPPVVFAINEPNLKGQAFIDPKTTAEVYQKVKSVADRYKITTVGPHMSLGSSNNDSIKAMDPIEKKEITYTFMTPFLKAFEHFAGNTEIAATAAHSYGNIGEFKWMVDMMYKDFKKPVWITEFASWQAPGIDAQIDYMIQAVDLMERTPHVEGYAWFKERAKDNPKISLLGQNPGELSALGEIYVNMPVHDPDVHYKLPGRLQLESYTTANGAEISRTKDTDGRLEMTVAGSGSWLDYQLYSERAQELPVKLRVATLDGAKIKLVSKGQTLGEFTAKGNGWQTLEGTVKLPQGPVPVRLVTERSARLNWLEFGAK